MTTTGSAAVDQQGLHHGREPLDGCGRQLAYELVEIGRREAARPALLRDRPHGVLALLQQAPEGLRAAGPAREITLLTSASLDGELKPCGCKLEPKGGLSRRAWYYAEVRRKHSATLTVEAGDFARAPDEFEGANVSGFMAATLGKLRYDAWTPGERELFYGPEGVTRLGQR